MKKLAYAMTAACLASTMAFAGGHAKTVKIGIALGFTGPAESLAEQMARGAELAIKEVNASGALLDSAKIEIVRADSTCVDASAAAAAAERLVSSERVDSVIGVCVLAQLSRCFRMWRCQKGLFYSHPQRRRPLYRLLKTMDSFSGHHHLTRVRVR